MNAVHPCKPSFAMRAISALTAAVYATIIPLWTIAPLAVASDSVPLTVPTPVVVKVNRSVPQAEPPKPGLQFSEQPGDEEISSVRVFAEPLIPAGDKTAPAENAALAKALKAYDQASQDERPKILTEFLASFPESPWKLSILVNLGLLYRSGGFHSKTIEAFELAWEAGKSQTDLRARTLADLAIGHLMEANARIGRFERLKQLFEEVDGRDLRGPGAEKVALARQGLWLMENKQERAFRCGAMALERILTATGVPQTLEINQKLENSRSVYKGMSLSELQVLSSDLGLRYKMAKRTPGAKIILPSLVHWKVGHYAAIVKEQDGKYLVQDPTSAQDVTMAAAAIDSESSGYFLVPNGDLPEGWASVTVPEGKKVWGRGSVGANTPCTPLDQTCTAKPWCPSHGMTVYNFDSNRISLLLRDTPLRYTPPLGGPIAFTLNYNQRDSSAPANPNYSNLGPQWNFNWCGYITVNWAVNSGTSEISYSMISGTCYGPGGGILTFPGTKPSAGLFYSPAIGDRVKNPPTEYRRRLPDGSEQVFGLADPALSGTNWPAPNTRYFLTKTLDPQGNATTYGYDSNYRLRTVTDALGQITELGYDYPGDIYKITSVTDPFGRFVLLGYNSSKQLSSITDTAGLVSSFSYGNNNFITHLTTPYGTTTFSNGDDGNIRWIEAVDPEGAKERIEYNITTPSWPSSDPANTVPSGFSNTNLCYRNTFYWSKKAMAEFPYDRTKAHLTHWLHTADMSMAADVPESEKEPFENRIWYSYLGQQYSYSLGSSNQPLQVARVLDNGHTQVYQYQYNNMGKTTAAIDPLGRGQTFFYADNQIDLVGVWQGGDLLRWVTYNDLHEPVTITDAAGQISSFSYNARGQILSATNAKQETTWYGYYPNSYPWWVTRPFSGATEIFAYDGFGRLSALINSDNYTTYYGYDAEGSPWQTLNRLASVTHPDGTTEEITYNRLDPEWTKDRLGRWSRRWYNAVGRLIATQSPDNRVTSYEWCTCGSLEEIVDPNGVHTTWLRDAQGRVTDKLFADNTGTHYTYENTTSRLKSVTDAMGQVTNYTYNDDNTVNQVTYNNTSHPTTGVAYTYDPNYTRVSTVTSGTETLTYRYNSVGWGILGAGQLAGIDAANYSVNYTTATGTPGYDELGRVISRRIDQGNTTETSYDSLGRVFAVTNPLGYFGYSYVNASGRLDHADLPNGQKVQLTYFDNFGDNRLQKISNLDTQSNPISQFDYTYNSVGNITSWTQANSGLTISQTYTLGYDNANQLTSATLSGNSAKNYHYDYDPAGNRIAQQEDDTATGASYNYLNQLAQQSAGGLTHFVGSVNKPSIVTVGGSTAKVDPQGHFDGTAQLTSGTNTVPITATDANGNTNTQNYQVIVSGTATSRQYDANGNLLNDGAKSYEWDAANRLVAINYTGTSKRTEYSYDPMGRRSRIVEKNGEAVVIDKYFVWSGLEICEERDSSNNVTRRFYPQGEQIAGQSYYYTRDHLGSVREMTDDGGTVRARYDYDLWGVRSANLITANPVESEFGYTGHYFHGPSGLHLAPYRAYDAQIGRWISRDPIGERGGLNLYGYVLNDPVNLIDLLGLWQVTYYGGRGFGGYVSIGNNGGSGWFGWFNGQWNGSAQVGVGVGDSISFDFHDNGCDSRKPGWGAVGTIAAGIGEGHLGGVAVEVNIDSNQGSSATLGGRIGPISASVTAQATDDNSSRNGSSTTWGVSNYGRSAFIGGGVSWAGH